MAWSPGLADLVTRSPWRTRPPRCPTTGAIDRPWPCPFPAIGLSGAGAEGAVEVLTLTVRPMIRLPIGTGTVPINGRGLAFRHTLQWLRAGQPQPDPFLGGHAQQPPQHRTRYLTGPRHDQRRASRRARAQLAPITEPGPVVETTTISAAQDREEQRGRRRLSDRDNAHGDWNRRGVSIPPPRKSPRRCLTSPNTGR
jgi:hypothetical protein